MCYWRPMASRVDQYRQLARECLKLANMVPPGPPRDTIIDMAYQWARLADEQDQPTDFLKASEPASEQPAAQQQQQIQSDDDKKE
jgi:hypothetical protein